MALMPAPTSGVQQVHNNHKLKRTSHRLQEQVKDLLCCGRWLARSNPKTIPSSTSQDGIHHLPGLMQPKNEVLFLVCEERWDGGISWVTLCPIWCILSIFWKEMDMEVAMSPSDGMGFLWRVRFCAVRLNEVSHWLCHSLVHMLWVVLRGRYMCHNKSGSKFWNHKTNLATTWILVRLSSYSTIQSSSSSEFSTLEGWGARSDGALTEELQVETLWCGFRICCYFYYGTWPKRFWICITRSVLIN